MSEKVSMYTSGKGQKQCFNGETFLASTEPYKDKEIKFRVSKRYIFGNGHNKNFIVIDSGNDAEFD